MKRQVVGLLIYLIAACIGGASYSQTVLTVVSTTSGAMTGLTMDQLMAMEQVEIVTSNEFVDGDRTFRGPLARDVLRLSHAEGAKIVTLTAANDYQVEVNPAEFYDYDAILALSMDGNPLSKRDKGPIWMIYPMNDHAELHDPVYNSRLIWQLVKMEYR